jgi:acylphosphatase
VQGVFFRAWTREQAQALGISGWMRNCSDGGVEAHLEGRKDAFDLMVEQMRQGPPSPEVEDVRVWKAEPCEFDGFEVRH